VEVIVLLGSDNFSPYVGRSDSILLVFYNPQNGNASLVSVPRDLYVYLPGMGMQRINSAYGSGGIELLYQTLEYNLGVRPRHWALAHLDDFIHFVDDLGGIDVNVTHPLPEDCGGVPEGFFHMDGLTALCYVRERKTSSDFDRSQRQQEVLRVIFDRFMSLDNIPRLPEWYRRYSNTVQTDLTPADLLSLVPFAVRHYQGGSLHHFQISWEDVTGWRVPETNASVLLPNREKILPKIQQAVDLLVPPVAAAQAVAAPAEETPTAEPDESVPDPVEYPPQEDESP
jgi:LCP family protein required for cell wall assembly